MKTKNVDVYLDGSRREKVLVVAKYKGQRYTEVFERDGSSHMMLLILEKLLKKLKCKHLDIKAVFIPIGPGSYTGLRVGASIAQMLRVLLNIPLNETTGAASVTLQYDPEGSDRYTV